MNKIKKKEMIKLIESLTDVNEAIAINKCLDFNNVICALTECQQAAISIGNCIESYYSEYGDIVNILESYCEDVYNLSIKIQNEFERPKYTKKIRKKLTDVKNKIYYLLPEEKKEIVFLPYKASMWDSLESVWKKSSVDESCNTYVIPIPYFDKNPDGTLGEMHYEGNEYPDYVSITSYEEYDIAERRPDEIYIHNPYDGYNKITTVSPEFYSKELRKHTDMLVYIPYFVAYNSNVEKHFCTLPGVIYSHKVIVQSEKARDIYIDEIHRFESEFNCKNAFGNVEEKIIAGGSPKYDKVMEAKREDFVLPESWTKLIYAADGNKKKVVLYNTTIKAMLMNPEKMMKKIEDVFEKFKSNTEVTLVWRPHPLLKASLKSMRDDYVKQYEMIEKKYVADGWGIYDDSSDMYRAIVWSDAYYGDGGSVAEIYKKTGKPIMLQNVDV